MYHSGLSRCAKSTIKIVKCEEKRHRIKYLAKQHRKAKTSIGAFKDRGTMSQSSDSPLKLTKARKEFFSRAARGALLY